MMVVDYNSREVMALYRQEENTLKALLLNEAGLKVYEEMLCHLTARLPICQEMGRYSDGCIKTASLQDFPIDNQCHPELDGTYTRHNPWSESPTYKDELINNAFQLVFFVKSPRCHFSCVVEDDKGVVLPMQVSVNNVNNFTKICSFCGWTISPLTS